MGNMSSVENTVENTSAHRWEHLGTSTPTKHTQGIRRHNDRANRKHTMESVWSNTNLQQQQQPRTAHNSFHSSVSSVARPCSFSVSARPPSNAPAHSLLRTRRHWLHRLNTPLATGCSRTRGSKRSRQTHRRCPKPTAASTTNCFGNSSPKDSRPCTTASERAMRTHHENSPTEHQHP